MTPTDVAAVAVMEGLKMVYMLVKELLNGDTVLMTPDEVRLKAERILRDVNLDEAVERRQFERLREQKQQKEDADKKSGPAG